MKSRLVIHILGLSCASWLIAAGLSTPFVDVKVKDVPLGVPYVVTHSAADGLLVQNAEPTPIHVRVNAYPPAATDLRGAAEPIPDLEWIHITPNEATIPPNGRYIFRVTLKIPNKKIYQGKEYQVMIWTKSESKRNAGVGINAGLVSRLRFQTKED